MIKKFTLKHVLAIFCSTFILYMIFELFRMMFSMM